MADRIRSVFSNKNTSALTLLVLLVGLSAATLAVQRSTETRQHASTVGCNVTCSQGSTCSQVPNVSYADFRCIQNNSVSNGGFCNGPNNTINDSVCISGYCNQVTKKCDNRSTQPDLVVSSLSALCSNNNLIISASIKNQGTGNAGTSKTLFYVTRKTDNSAVLNIKLDTNSLPSGSSQSLTYSIPCLPSTYVISVGADSEGQIPESNKSNNIKSIEFTPGAVIPTSQPPQATQPPTQNTQPVGTTDEINSSTCSVRGWVYDPDTSSSSVTIHVYRDGQAGSGVAGKAYTANTSRPDVNSAFNITGNHGFDITFSPSGDTFDKGFFDGKTHTIYVYAIDTAGGNNPLLGMTNGISRTITCSSTPPSASKGSIQGYNVEMPGNKAYPAGTRTVYLDGGFPTTDNPYGTGSQFARPEWNNISAGNHTVSVTVPSGFNVGYTLCYNAINCHNNTPTPGSSVIVNVPAGGYADLWWHFTPKPADIDRNGAIDIIDFNLWLSAFKGTAVSPYTAGGKTYYPNVNSDSAVDLLDFNVWLQAFKTQ